MRRSGVVGVVWGVQHHRRDGARRLRIHVQHKHDLAELHPRAVIPRRVEGLRTRVVQVGEPAGQHLTCKDYVRASDARISTTTALVHEDPGWFALVSGHGTLPIQDGVLASEYAPDGSGVAIGLTDVSSGTELPGKLQAGRLSATQDWGVVQIAMPDAPVDLRCPATGTYRPPIRTTALGYNQPVKQFSVLDRTTRQGTVTGYGQVRLKLADGNRYLYTRVLEVHGIAGSFSRDGDSGSLVADDQGRAIGVVIGAAEPPSDPDRSSYVLPLASDTGSVPSGLRRFFS